MRGQETRAQRRTASHGRGRFQLPRQSFSRDVQPALDRTDRRIEGCAHLRQRFAADVKRLERRAVQVAELCQATVHRYAFASTDEPVAQIAERLWQFCFAALGGQPEDRPPGAGPRTGRKRPAG